MERKNLFNFVCMNVEEKQNCDCFFFCGKSFPFYYSFVMPTNSGIQCSTRRRSMEVGQQGSQTTPIAAIHRPIPMTLNCQIMLFQSIDWVVREVADFLLHQVYRLASHKLQTTLGLIGGALQFAC